MIQLEQINNCPWLLLKEATEEFPKAPGTLMVRDKEGVLIHAQPERDLQASVGTTHANWSHALRLNAFAYGYVVAEHFEVAKHNCEDIRERFISR